MELHIDPEHIHQFFDLGEVLLGAVTTSAAFLFSDFIAGITVVCFFFPSDLPDSESSCHRRTHASGPAPGP